MAQEGHVPRMDDVEAAVGEDEFLPKRARGGTAALRPRGSGSHPTGRSSSDWTSLGARRRGPELGHDDPGGVVREDARLGQCRLGGERGRDRGHDRVSAPVTSYTFRARVGKWV